ncbi:hypothetical protein ACQJBY_001169 [Aegilops geniculata]
MAVIVSRGDERGAWCVHLQVKRRLLQGVVTVVLARERERSVLRPFSGYCFQFISDSSCRFHVVVLICGNRNSCGCSRTLDSEREQRPVCQDLEQRMKVISISYLILGKGDMDDFICQVT